MIVTIGQQVSGSQFRRMFRWRRMWGAVTRQITPRLTYSTAAAQPQVGPAISSQRMQENTETQGATVEHIFVVTNHFI